MTSGGIERAAGVQVAIASVVSGVAAYACLAVAASVLSPAQNASFLLFWAIQFAMFGVLIGVQSEITRDVHANELGADTPGGDRVRVLPAAISAGIALALVAALVAIVAFAASSATERMVAAAAVVVGVVSFSGHAAVTGSLSGVREWRWFARLVAAESTMRLVLMGLVAALGAGISGLAIGAAAAASTWVVFAVLSPTVRSAAAARGAGSRSAFRQHALHAATAAAASTVLVVGYPVLMRLTATAAEFREAAPLILAIMLTRAPLLMPIGAFQGVIITHVMGARARGQRVLAPRVALAVPLVTAGLVGAAALVGPPALALFGDSYRVDAPTFAVLTLAATLLAIATIVGTVCLASGRHTAYSAGWMVATIGAVLALVGPGDLQARALLSLLLAPCLGLIVHGWALRSTSAPERAIATSR